MVAFLNQSQEAVVTLTNQFDGYDYSLVSGRPIDVVINAKAHKTFSLDVIRFFGKLSSHWLPLCTSPELSRFSSFFFYCREQNLLKIQRNSMHLSNNVGLGSSFNIAPSNVPLNSLYSLLFTLLSGSPCILRVSESTKDALAPFFSSLTDLADDYSQAIPPFSIVCYPRDSKLTSSLSSIVHSRVVWGGDSTASFVRSLPCIPSCRDIFFPNRTSCAVVDLNSFSELPDLSKDLHQLSKDITMFAQQACSSPLHIFFIGNKFDYSNKISSFFRTLDDVISKSFYDSYLPKDCLDSALHINLANSFLEPSYSGTYIRAFPIDLSNYCYPDCQFKNGTFTYSISSSINELPMFCHFQTVVFFPFPDFDTRLKFFNLYYHKFDRLVAPGRAIDMHESWDGNDIIGSLSRKVFY